MDIKPEYPKGLHFLEMQLVDMLIEQRSWNCRMKIGMALVSIRNHAKNMKKEQDHLYPQSSRGITKNETCDTDA